MKLVVDFADLGTQPLALVQHFLELLEAHWGPKPKPPRRRGFVSVRYLENGGHHRIGGNVSSITLQPGESVEVDAGTAFDEWGNVVPITEESWSTSDESVATVAPNADDPTKAVATSTGKDGTAVISCAAVDADNPDDSAVAQGTVIVAGHGSIRVFDVKFGTPQPAPTPAPTP
jgi:hypothetical protein